MTHLKDLNTTFESLFAMSAMSVVLSSVPMGSFKCFESLSAMSAMSEAGTSVSMDSFKLANDI